MILYKHVSLEAGLKILESRAIGFSEPRDFNDPFETAARPCGSFGEGPGLFVQGPENTKPKKAKFLFTHNNHTSNI
jgi:hypothetical protein